MKQCHGSQELRLDRRLAGRWEQDGTEFSGYGVVVDMLAGGNRDRNQQEKKKSSASA
ncbi:MAG: hypothetical protein ABSB82_20265 [Terriglobia bacterium]